MIPSPDVLCAYLEPLAQDARVVVIGDARCAERLTELGARSVHVFDPDPSRKVAAPHGVSVQPLPDHDFDVRDGAFDVALVPDLAELPDAPATLARLRRVLGPSGVLLACASNPEVTGRGIGYYDLYDRIALQFANVRMIGVVAFRGTTLAELGIEDEEPDVSVDTQLVVEPPPPYAFCALASQSEEVGLTSYAIVQEPLRDNTSEKLADALAQLAVAEKERADLERVLATKAETDVGQKKIDEGELRAAHARAITAENKLADLDARAHEAESRAARAESELAEANARVTRAEARANEAEERAASRADDAEARLAAEIAELEKRLEERGKTVADLEQEVRRREKIARELVLALEQSQTDASTQEKIEALAKDLARRQSELEAMKWRVQELEQKLAAPAGSDEVGALRQALSQEHAARMRAESGEELAQARAELQKQAVLLAQKSEGT